MRTKDRSLQLTELVTLSEALAQSAQVGLHKAASEHELAQSNRDRSREERDAAQCHWDDLVCANSPQPELVRLGANWLLLQERQLAEQDLAVSIAANQLAHARSEYAQALARDMATRETQREFARNSSNRLSRKQDDVRADEILWRRAR